MNLRRTIKLRWYLWNRYQKWEHPAYREYLYWKDRFVAWKKSLALKRAIRLAHARSNAENKRVYVLPDDKGKPRAFTTKEIELLKRHKLMSRKATCNDLFRESIYIANPNTKTNGKKTR